MDPKYPNITVDLSNEDGNVFNLIGVVSRALRAGGVDSQTRSEFQTAVMGASGYDNVLQIIMQWVNVT